MKRAAIVALLLPLASCSNGGTNAQAPTTTVPVPAEVSSALLTASKLRRVPGFSTAKVANVASLEVFDDPDPRGPCGTPVPRLDLSDAAGAGWATSTIRTGAQIVLRRPAKELQSYVAARIRDARGGCPVFTVKNRAGEPQEMRFAEAIGVTRDADQSLAVVTAVRVEGAVRAVTTIEVRTNDVLSRAIIVTARPLATPTVRGLASLMAKSLEAFAH